MTIKHAMANDTTAAMKDFPDSGAETGAGMGCPSHSRTTHAFLVLPVGEILHPWASGACKLHNLGAAASSPM